MKKTILYAIILLHSTLLAQNKLEPIVVNSAGNTFNNGNSTLYYSVGEAAITTISSGSSTLLQGFLQTDVATSIDTSSCRYKDSLQLIALYNATTGASWTNKWDLKKPMSTWYGVSLNTQGCVQYIDLDGGSVFYAEEKDYPPSNNLVGTIPNLNLPNLKTLILDANPGLTGTLPSLPSCIQLEVYNIAGTSISGAIPTFTQSSLKYIGICCNKLTGSIPNQIALNCPNLLGFYIQNNKDVSGNLPPAFGSLTQLGAFTASNCNLSGCFPSTYNNLCTKQQIGFSANPLLPHQGNFAEYCKSKISDGKPCDDGNPNTTDDKIDASCNCKGTLKITCRQTDSLQLWNWYATYNIPIKKWNVNWAAGVKLENWKGVTLNANGCLSKLYLANDKTISGTLDNFTFSEIQSLELGICSLSGTIPALSLPTLTLLSLQKNNFTGTIPNFSLPNLESLFLDTNPALTGNVPAFNMPKLKTLYLSDNTNLDGTVATLDLPELTYLGLSNCKLKGNLPDLKLPKLETLFADANQFSGFLPDFTYLKNIKKLHLENNNFSGCFRTAHDKICNLSYTSSFFVDGYNFNNNPKLSWKGDFSEYCKVKNAVGAPCDDGNANTTNDVIDATCFCKGQLKIDTSSCRYKDSLQLWAWFAANNIPTKKWNVNWAENIALNNWTGIRLNANGCVGCVDLDGNNNLCSGWGAALGVGITNTFPTAICRLPQLEYLSLRGNQMKSKIPDSIQYLKKLIKFYVDSCNLQGPIPDVFWTLDNLVDASLNYNNFNTELSPKIENLKKLLGFSISDSKMKGTIPKEIGNCTALNYFYARNNQLSGTIPQEITKRKLQSLILYNNEIDSVSDMSKADFKNFGYTWWGNGGIEISDNKLTFNDIVPNMIFAQKGNGFVFTYSPQDSCGKYQSFAYKTGDNLTIDVGIDYGISSNTYQWYKDKQKLTNQTQRQLVINNLQLSDAGNYYCEIKNSIATALTLNRRLIKVVVNKQPCPTLPKPIFVSKQLSTCKGKSVQISAGTWNNYKWSNGASTNNITVSQTGKYKVTVSDDQTCFYTDSLQVNFGNQIIKTYKDTICFGSNYKFNDTLRNVTGTYCKIFVGAAGCDSLHCVNLMVTPKIKDTPLDISICDGKNYLYRGETYNKTGTYPVKLISKEGCDSLIMLKIKVFDAKDIQLQADEFSLSVQTRDTILYPFKNDKFPQGSSITISAPQQGIVTFIAPDKFRYQNTKSLDNSIVFNYKVCLSNCPTVCAESKIKLLLDDDSIEKCIAKYGKDIFNAVTPNHNEKNAYFDPAGDLIKNCPIDEKNTSLSILNPQGDVIFHSNYEKWYGTKNNNPNGPPVESGIYYFIFSTPNPKEPQKTIRLKGKLLVMQPND